MADIDRYFDEIDAARTRRVRELSELKRKFGSERDADPTGVNSKAVTVLTYANWEGFYNDCVRAYVQFLAERGKKVRETDWMLLVGAFNSDFEVLRTRNHSAEAKQEFVANLKSRLDCNFDSFDCSTVEARSNLNFARLTQNYCVLNFDLHPLQRYRNRLDRELVGWRHSVAHGDSPDLSTLDIYDHVDFTALVLLIVANIFQQAILERM